MPPVHLRTPFTLSDRRANLSRIVLVLALLVAGFSALGIVLLQHSSDEHRRAQVVLGSLLSKAYELNALQKEAVGESDLDYNLVDKAGDLDRQINGILATLNSMQIEAGDITPVQSAYSAYHHALNEELTLLVNNNQQKAICIDQIKSDPDFSALRDVINGVTVASGKAAERARRAADIGTTLALILAGLTMVALMRAFDQMQYNNTVLLLRAEQAALAESEKRFRSLVRNSTDTIAIIGEGFLLKYVSPTVERAWGYTQDKMQGTPGIDYLHPDDAAHTQAMMAQAALQPGTNFVVETRLRHADGSWRYCEMVVNAQLDDPGIEGILATYRDITERKNFEQQLTHQAFHDALTDLPNRALFMDRLGRALARQQRHANCVAVLFLDLDNFKVINDSLGHQSGDQLLTSVTERLLACVREEDTVARLGGDEFTVLLDDIGGLDDAQQASERIIAALQEPLHLKGREVFVSASIGIAVASGAAAAPDMLLRDADTAMYQAKGGGKGRIVVFDGSMSSRALERLEMEADLRRAIDSDELRLHYQPILLLEDGTISEVEALVRWEHPERGLIPPSKFISLAEETSLIVPMGFWVLREACRQAQAWREAFPAQSKLIIGVNVSARQLQESDLIEQVAQILQETGLPAGNLKLEITESVIMQDAEASVRQLERLRVLGTHLAIDDFGTGYSSMTYLSSFPIDTLKIDRSFIQRLGPSSDDQAIVQAIVTLAKSLNLRVTSEGIETAEQLALLKSLGCDRGQGYLFARPLSNAAMYDLLKECVTTRDLQFAA